MQNIALELLKGKLLAIQREQELQQIADIRGDQVRAEWGQQIRNYTLNPYSLVKDVRTRHESSQVEAVLDGALGPFMEAYLQLRGEQQPDAAGG